MPVVLTISDFAEFEELVKNISFDIYKKNSIHSISQNDILKAF